MKISNFFFDPKLAQSEQFQISNNRVYGFRAGQFLIILLILISVVLILTTSMFTRLATFIKFGDRSAINDQATVLADGGVDYVIAKLNETSGSYSGNPTLTIEKDSIVFGQIEIAFTGSDSQPRMVTSTGYIPSKANPRAKRTVTVTVKRPDLQVSFPYALHGLDTGVTAITVNSVFNAVTGNVHSNTTISCAGTSPQINGTRNYVTSAPSINCGTPVNQTSQQSAPILNIGDGTTPGWKKAAADGGIMDCPAGCTWNGMASYPLGPKKITGNVTVGPGTYVYVTGPVWITGNLTVSGGIPSAASLSLDNSLASCGGTVIAVDGNITLTGNSTITASGSPKKYLILAQTTQVAGNGISVNGTSFPTQYEAIFYSANTNGQALSDISFSGANLLILGTAVGKRVSVTSSARTRTGVDLANAKFCGQSNTFEVQRGSYKISK